MKSARKPPAPQSFGLAFPGELTDEQEKKEKKRRQQQEMQMALAAQIKEQKARKETDRSEARAEAAAAAPREEPGSSGPWEGMGRSGPQLGPRRRPEPSAVEPDQRELERRRQQQELSWERGPTLR